MSFEKTKMNGVFANTSDTCDSNLDNNILDTTYIKRRAGIACAKKIAYLGGSISSSHLTPWHLNLKETLKQYNILIEEEKNFSLGGVGAFFSIFNLTEIVNYAPSIVFIDFTVNEISTKDFIIIETFGRILSFLISNQIECCIVHNYHTHFQKDFNAKKIPNTITVLEKLADQLNVPSINFAQYFGDCIRENKLVNANFLGDSCHLSVEAFSQIFSFYEQFKLKDLFNKNPTTTQQYLQEYKNLTIFYHKPSPLLKEIILPDKQTQGNVDARVVGLIQKFIKNNKNATTYLWEEAQEIYIKFHGKWLFVHDIMGPTNGKIQIKINQDPEFYISRFDSYCSEQFRNHFFAIDCKEIGNHTIRLKLVKEPKKEEILSSRNKTIKYKEDLDITNNYVLQICSI